VHCPTRRGVSWSHRESIKGGMETKILFIGSKKITLGRGMGDVGLGGGGSESILSYAGIHPIGTMKAILQICLVKGLPWKKTDPNDLMKKKEFLRNKKTVLEVGVS